MTRQGELSLRFCSTWLENAQGERLAQPKWGDIGYFGDGFYQDRVRVDSRCVTP